MADMKPIGIDQSTGQQRTTEFTDSAVDNLGAQIQLGVTQAFDYSGNLRNNVRPLFRWGADYQKLADPATRPVNCRSLAWSSNNEYLVAADLSSPFIRIYQRTSTTFNQISDPATLPTTGSIGVDISPDGEFVAYNNSGAGNGTLIYQRSGNTFTNLGTPATIPIGSCQECKFSPNGEFLAVTSSGSALDRRPYLHIYQREGTVFTKLPDPATLPGATDNADSVDWSPNGEFLAITSGGTSPKIMIYQRQGTTFTKIADPATLPTGFTQKLRWSPNGEFLASCGQSAGTTLDIYQQNGTTFTRLADPATISTGDKIGLAWSPDSRFLVATFSPYDMWERSGTTFTRVADPATLPGGGRDEAAWSPDGQFLAITSQGDPDFTIYQTPNPMPSSGILTINGVKRAGD